MAAWTTGLHPEFVPWATWLVAVAQASGYGPVVTSAYRTRRDQERLYRRYQQGLSPYPAARPGTSRHEYGLAIDIDTPTDRSVLPQLGALWQRYGGRWYASDPVHFEA